MTGKTLSTNSVNQSVDVFTNIINEAYQQCTGSNVQSQIVSISGNVGSVINVNNVSFTQSAQTYSMCEQTGSFLTDIQQNISQNSDQVAKAIQSGFSILPGTSEADNIANLTTQIATEISNTYVNDCTFSTNQTQLLNIANNVNSNVNVDNVTFNQSMEVVNTCISQNSTVTNLSQQIAQAVDQSAKSKSIGILGIIAAVLVLGMIFIALVVILLIPGFGFVLAASGSGSSKEVVTTTTQ